MRMKQRKLKAMSFKKAFKSIFNIYIKKGFVSIRQVWNISKRQKVNFDYLCLVLEDKGLEIRD